MIASTSKVDPQSFIADALDLSGREGLVGNLETTRDQVRDPVGQILAVFAIMILGVWTATQWTADQLGHQAALGRPFAVVLGLPLYEPWRLFGWWFHYEAYAPQVFDRAGLLAGASGFLG